MDDLIVRAGDASDYAALARHHYLANRPATMTRVLAIEDRSPTVRDRWRAMGGNPEEAEPSASATGGRVAAVLVESLPALSCAMRDAALPGRYTGWRRRASARLLNEEVRCISRVIVHPQFRGLGLAVRLVREALATAATAYTEALAAMGWVHPFFRRAGMTEYRRPPHARDQRLLDALRAAGIEPWELAAPARLRRRLAGAADAADERRAACDAADGDAPVEPDAAALFAHELGRWAGRRRSFEEQLDLARRRLMVEPVYYLHTAATPEAPPCIDYHR